MISAILCAYIVCAGIEVSLAPDQPLPMVYVGEPLIVELLPDASSTETVRIECENTVTGDTESTDAGPLNLVEGQPYWIAVDDFLVDRGHYTVTVYLTSTEETVLGSGAICKVDRAPEEPFSTLFISMDTADARAATAFMATGAGGVSVDVAAAGFLDDIAPMMEVRIAAPEGRVPDITTDEWLITETADSEAIAATRKALIDMGVSRIPWIDLTCGDDMDAVAPALERVPVPRWRLPYSDPYSWDALTAFRDRAERNGWETSTWSAVIDAADPNDWIRAATMALRFGADRIVVPMPRIWNGTSFEPQFVNVIAMAHVIRGIGRPVGQIAIDDDHIANIFNSDAGWMGIVHGAPARIENFDVAIGDGANVRLFDAYGKEFPQELTEPGVWRIESAVAPVYILGTGGELRTQAAQATARAEAQRLLAFDDIDTILPDAAVRALTIVVGEAEDILPRRDFLLALQAYPALEQIIAADADRMPDVVPVMAGLTRLLEAQCVIEQSRGEIFLAARQTRIDRAREMQAQFVTAHAGAGLPLRAASLIDEIQRLSAASAHAARLGRGIEADGLAAIAEWRARSLAFTQ